MPAILPRTRTHGRALVAILAIVVAPVASAQGKPAAQVVKPPVAQLWMDVATLSAPGMPAIGSMPSLGALLGGRAGAEQGNNAFGNTRGMGGGRFVDIALYTQRRPGGAEATQSVPASSTLAPGVPLLPPKPDPRSRAADAGADPVEEHGEPPRGRILFYWGCGETVRAGQPRVLDFAKSPPAEWGQFMQGRAPRERGAVSRQGHSVWPNERDRRHFGRDASLAGEHAVSGEGVPADLRFRLGAAQDFMAPIALQQAGASTEVLRLSWGAVQHARGYFINAMGGGGDGSGIEMVMWSSSEQPDFGMGLLDYASPANIEQWLREQVLLPADATQCAIPQGIFAKTGGAMLRMIAYGPELNLAHPPRPADVKIPWEPDWAVRVRNKSTVMAMLGGDTRGQAAGSRGATSPERGTAPASASAPDRGSASAARPDCPPPSGGDGAAAALGGALGGNIGRAVGGALGGLFGRKDERRDVPADCPR